MTKIVLITGASGFVGYQLVREFINIGAKVRVIVRPDKKLLFLQMAGIERITETEDLFAETTQWWRQALDGVDILIHAAWSMSGGTAAVEGNVKCLSGSLNLALAVKESAITRFVGIGTCAEYDYLENKNKVVDVNTNLKPQSVYGSAKASLFFMLSAIFNGSNVQFLWCRLFYLYGEREKGHRLIPYINRQLSKGETVVISNCQKVRDYMDVSDAAKKITKIALGRRVGAVNICSGIAISIKEIAVIIAKKYKREDLIFCLMNEKSKDFDPDYVVGTRDI
jgi:nucleoside-diphosphate-sugar epimerase